MRLLRSLWTPLAANRLALAAFGVVALYVLVALLAP